MNWRTIANEITAATGETFQVEREHVLGGGCINEAVCLQGDGRRYFVKLNRAELLPMFEAEAAGLAVIVASRTLRAPAPVTWGSEDGRSYLVLEHIEFGSPGPRTSSHLGERLAAMHRVCAQAFGWDRDNTIGSTPQVNTADADWVSFLREQRLRYQLDLARANGADAGLLDGGERLLDALPRFFDNYYPHPSLLHGDLWGGNWSADAEGQPVIFDPAVYFGDREADLAMTELFGGFDDRFYHSYRQAWPLDAGYNSRKVLYNLYHVLNHYNLFGGGYARQARGMIETLLAELS